MLGGLFLQRFSPPQAMRTVVGGEAPNELLEAPSVENTAGVQPFFPAGCPD